MLEEIGPSPNPCCILGLRLCRCRINGSASHTNNGLFYNRAGARNYNSPPARDIPEHVLGNINVIEKMARYDMSSLCKQLPSENQAVYPGNRR